MMSTVIGAPQSNIAPPAPPAGAASRPPAPAGQASSGSPTELSAEALALITKLKARDTEVRQHEQAHLAAAGGLARSGASYTYQRGPDGVNYAVGGEVQIDTSPGRTPEETIARARTISAAALAPADPSGADRAVAAQALQLEQQARAELALKQEDEPAPEPVSRSVSEARTEALRRAYGFAEPAAVTIDVSA
jgi:hypothetical protein